MTSSREDPCALGESLQRHKFHTLWGNLFLWLWEEQYWGRRDKVVSNGHQELGRHSFLRDSILGMEWGPLSPFHFPIASTQPSQRVQLSCVVLTAHSRAAGPAILLPNCLWSRASTGQNHYQLQKAGSIAYCIACCIGAPSPSQLNTPMGAGRPK